MDPMRLAGVVVLAAQVGCAAAPSPANRAPDVVVPAPAVAERCRDDRAAVTSLSDEADRLMRSDVNAAVERYVRAVEIEPSNEPLLWKLSLAYERKQDWAGAASTLTRLSELAPDLAPVWHRLGQALVELGDAGDARAYERAKEPLRRCVERDPNLAECHELFGRACERTGEDQAALEAFTVALRRDPTRAGAYPRLAEMYVALRRLELAAAVAREGLRVLERNTKTRAALYRLSMVLAADAAARRDRAAQLAALQGAEESLEDENEEGLFALGSDYAGLGAEHRTKALVLLRSFRERACRGSAAAPACDDALVLIRRLSP